MRLQDILEIDAPPELVWTVTVDVERWPEWNDVMQSVSRVDPGPLELGSRARIKQRAMAEAEWTVTGLVEGERFSWVTRKPGLRMTGSHEVTPLDGGTRSRLAVEVSGFLGAVLWPLMFLPIRWSLRNENRKLKEECESRATRQAIESSVGG